VVLALTQDVWSHEVRNGEIDVHLSREARAAVERAGIPFEVLIEDVPAMIESQATERAARAVEGGIAGEDWWADVKNLAAINAKLDEWIAAYPGLVSSVTVGTSLQGRIIRGIRISLAPSGAAVPAFLFDSCQHAREWATPMVSMLVADRLIEGAASDPTIGAMLTAAEILIVPVVNPDGYQHSWDQVRLWRKNRRDNGDGSFGVDLNRNWGFQWGGQGASANPSSETYRGPAPFSEPETQALRDFVLANGRIIGHIDFHSYSQLILWPWGWTADLCVDQPLFESLAASMQSAIESVHGRLYSSGPIYTGIYPASGTIVDWAYGAAAARSTTIEARDTGTYGFLIPPAEVRPCAEENAQAALAMITTLLVPGFLSVEGSPPTSAIPDEQTPFTVFASPLVSTFALPPRLNARIGTSGSFTPSDTAPLGDGRYAAALPAAPCGAVIDWYLDWEGDPSSVSLPAAAGDQAFRTVSSAFGTLHFEAFETAGAWVSGIPGDTATSGHWIRVDPVGTIAQPEDDHTPAGTMCWVTGQGVPGGSAGAADVDGGVTTLTSSWLDGGDPESTLRYWRWYSNNLGGAPNSDSMLVLYSLDDVSWSLLEEVSASATAWIEASFNVGDFVQPPGLFKLRFVARDLGAGSLVEAGVDDVLVEAPACGSSQGDVNLDGVVNGADLSLVLGSWGPCNGCAADVDGNGAVDGADLAVVLGAWSP